MRAVVAGLVGRNLLYRELIKDNGLDPVGAILAAHHSRNYGNDQESAASHGKNHPLLYAGDVALRCDMISDFLSDDIGVDL